MKIKLVAQIIWGINNAIITVLVLYFLGGYTHEGDIQRQCRETGKATGWRGDLVCSPAEK